MRTATAYRLAIALAVFTILFLVYGVGALGIIGAGGERDRMYAGVLAVALVGALLARLRPRGMTLAMTATALAQVVCAVIALAAGWQHEEGASVLEIVGLNAMYAALFGSSAWLFRRAAEQQRPVAAGTGG